MLLEHKVGIVTGSSKGIGRCIAEELARQGADLIINGTNEALLEDVRQTIVEIGRKCQIVRGDISDYETSLALRQCAEEEFGRVEILVNNAGINDRTSTMELTNEAWQRVLDINLNGVFYTSKALIPLMIQQNSGNIINITSANGVTPHPNASPAYGASKAAVTYLTRHFANEFAKNNIRVNAVQCGPIESDMTGQWTPEYREISLKKIPLHRLGKAKDVANAVVFLASEKSDFVTGTSLNLSGGKLMY